MKKNIALLAVIFSLFIHETVLAQTQSWFHSLRYPRTLVSSAMGEQGVAHRNHLDAMAFNPANLVHSDGITFSYYRNPMNRFGFQGKPLSLGVFTVQIGEKISAGIEYTDWDFGGMYFPTGEGITDFERIYTYERSLAAGFGYSFRANLSAGVQIRLVRSNILTGEAVNHFLYSAGIAYSPDIFSDRIQTDLSFINFGTAIDFGIVERLNPDRTITAPTPAQINFGFVSFPVVNEYFDLRLGIGVSKRIQEVSYTPYFSAGSSFKGLFTDWDDFPDDSGFHIGLGYLWEPMYIISGVSFFQEMYIGYFSRGRVFFNDSHLTHGFAIGLAIFGVKSKAGYSGRWHDNKYLSNYFSRYPWETFYFSMGYNGILFGERKQTHRHRTPIHLILSGGYGHGYALGRLNERTSSGITTSTTIGSLWSLNADFYISEIAAVVSSFGYNKIKEAYSSSEGFLPDRYERDVYTEIFSFDSGFRYHAIRNWSPFFIQGSLGIIRLNPISEYSHPRYRIKTFTEISTGYLISLPQQGFILIPTIALKTIFMEIEPDRNRIAGYNQIELGVNIGYRF